MHTCAQYEETPLRRAAEKGHANCVLLLLDAGADKEAKNKVRRRGAFLICRRRLFEALFSVNI